MTFSVAESLSSLPDSERDSILTSLSTTQADDLLYNWDFWARPEQKLPPGDWVTWLILAGRGFGKTKTGSENIRQLVCGDTPLAAGEYHQIALVAETAADARDVMVEGPSGILTVHPKDFRPIYESSKRRVTWPNGAKTGSETIRQLVCGDTPLAAGEYSQIALVAETAADARDVMVEGPSGILTVHPKDFRPIYESSKRRVTWPNGARASDPTSRHSRHRGME